MLELARLHDSVICMNCVNGLECSARKIIEDWNALKLAEALERWKPVVDFEGLYEVSDMGRVRNARTGRMRKLVPGWCAEYLAVQLSKDNHETNFQVHVLVASAFLGPAPEGLEVNHKDGNKGNPKLLNLEYLTRSDNLKHAYRTGLRIPNVPFGENHHAATLDHRQIQSLKEKRIEGLSYVALGTLFGVNFSTARRICSGQSRRRG